MSKIKITAKLDGEEVEVVADLGDVFDQITSEQLVEEFRERGSDDEVREFLDDIADDYCSHDDFGNDDPASLNLNDWDLAELRKAVALDDGRRAVDLLKKGLT